MPLDYSFTAALLVGLLGSSHCIGMCGGIVAALNMGAAENFHAKPKSLLLFQLSYNSGRISSYLLVGWLAGNLGAGLMHLGLNPVVGKLMAAAFMVALGLYLANWWRGLAVLEKAGLKLWRHIQPLAQRLLPIRTPSQAYLLGILWGWLPCGLVYAVVVWALTTADAYHSALLMLGFGIGTLPAMLIAGNLLHYLQRWIKSPWVRSTAGVSLIAFGLYSGINGLNHQHHQHHADLSNGALLVSAIDLTPTPAMRRKAW